jgi:hypothetical protein
MLQKFSARSSTGIGLAEVSACTRHTVVLVDYVAVLIDKVQMRDRLWRVSKALASVPAVICEGAPRLDNLSLSWSGSDEIFKLRGSAVNYTVAWAQDR